MTTTLLPLRHSLDLHPARAPGSQDVGPQSLQYNVQTGGPASVMAAGYIAVLSLLQEDHTTAWGPASQIPRMYMYIACVLHAKIVDLSSTQVCPPSAQQSQHLHDTISICSRKRIKVLRMGMAMSCQFVTTNNRQPKSWAGYRQVVLYQSTTQD